MDLKPCPFCGSDSVELVSSDAEYNSHYVECSCSALGECESTTEKAIEAWNTRSEEENIARKTIEDFCDVLRNDTVFCSNYGRNCVRTLLHKLNKMLEG